MNHELKPVNLRLGISDGTNTELLSTELQLNMEVVSGVTGLGATRALPGQGAYEHVLQVKKGTSEFGRAFPIGQDWSDTSGLNFWYYGQNSGRDVVSNRSETGRAGGIVDTGGCKLFWS